jgi:pimeloyl-ACP methyl ester carboxylesterase
VINQLTEKNIDFNNHSISYLEGGNSSSSAPILFLHGWSISVESYEESLSILAGRYHVIAPYLPGFNKSTSPKFLQDYNDYAQCIIDFVNALNLKKVHLIGHSIGGAIGIALAVSMPSLVSSLSLVDSTGIPLGFLPQVLLRRSIEIAAQMGEMKLEVVSKMYQSSLYNWFFRPHNVIQMAWVSLEKDIRPLLSKIEAPSLVLWGEKDLFTPLKMGQEFSEGIKGSRLIVLEGEYHEWSLFRPEKFAPLIFDFIDEIEQLV